MTSEPVATPQERPDRKIFRITDYVKPSELNRFAERSTARAVRMVAFNWAMIALIFAGVALWTNPLTILLGIVLLSGRMLGFAALMHDCGHNNLFPSPRANALVGQWLCAYPVLTDVHRYAAGHRRHHALAGTREDPDLPNYQAYPITRESFRRKVKRDLTGRTAWKILKAIWRGGRSHLGEAPWKGNFIAGYAIVNGAMFAVLLATGHGWLYLMWPAAYMTVYMLILRLRQVAEHGAVPDLYDPDPRLNTRTTHVGWWERPLFGPFNLNYHLEHHIHAGIPCYRLKDFHRFLRARGFYDETHFPSSYGELFEEVVPA
jgi:fatty acid desaturase